MRALFHTLLPPEVCQAASRFKFQAGQQRKVLGELLLRALLYQDYQINPGEIQLSYTQKNKPYLRSHPGIHFNISHSGAWVVIAFSTAKVGIDVEKIKRVNLNIARRFFSEDEKKQLFSFDAQEQTNYFFDLWTLKESYLKAVGTGLTKPLKSFTIIKESNDFRILGSESTEGVVMKQLKIERNYRLSVCSLGDSIHEQFSVLYLNDLLHLINQSKEEAYEEKQ
jgi:4'-phosphopantetheinyl transferase